MVEIGKLSLVVLTPEGTVRTCESDLCHTTKQTRSSACIQFSLPIICALGEFAWETCLTVLTPGCTVYAPVRKPSGGEAVLARGAALTLVVSLCNETTPN